MYNLYTDDELSLDPLPFPTRYDNNYVNNYTVTGVIQGLPISSSYDVYNQWHEWEFTLAGTVPLLHCKMFERYINKIIKDIKVVSHKDYVCKRRGLNVPCKVATRIEIKTEDKCKYYMVYKSY